MCSFCTRLIDSMPPATAIVTPSRITERAATAIACKPEAHCRSIVVPATVTGNPARIAPLACDVHRRGALLHGTAHDDVLDLTRLHVRASHRLADHMPSHCRTF